jgi:hypothetical protein
MITVDTKTVIFSDSKFVRSAAVLGALALLVTALGIAGIAVIFRGDDWVGDFGE